ncbi:hypothetical protein H2248_011009 [Termitomyces sp. 'cryptogamus']|nr:hypothetical protein H2248_011009 [Termitomyces sp. 'cryptogamus']
MPWASDVQALVYDILTFQVEELGWTAFSLVSMSLVFIYSISAAGDPRPPHSSLIPPNYLARSQERKAKIVAAKKFECGPRPIFENCLLTECFQLKQLPPELQLLVLSYSTDWPETYRALVLVSRYIYHLTLRACLPIMPITISSSKQLTSFASLVHRNKSSRHCRLPPDLGNLVHRLWISPLRNEDFVHTYHILRACGNVRVLACDARGIAMITSSPKFKHTMCTDLTLLLSHPQWSNALNTPSGLQFLRQLTHLRVMGEESVPKTMFFDHLLYLSYSERSRPDSDMDDSEIKRPLALSNMSIFPSLRQVVLTRRCGMKEKAPVLCDPRLVLLHVRRDRAEMEIWRNGIKGQSLWQQAAKALPATKKSIIVG